MRLLLGDCLIKLKELEDNSIDAIVTDPPYGLSFMGKKWDYDVPKKEIWQECLRVLKPGGYLLSFAGTRTQHRMAVNIEDAGFEIRDMIAWVYGSGFPKSLNIGKAVDKLQGNEREELGDIKPAGFKTAASGYTDTKAWSGKVSKGTSQWEGWGTALKPALEPITVARKPLEKGLNVASNCLKWGVGGINIDGSRVGSEDDLTKRYNSSFQEGNSQFVSETATKSGNRMEIKAPEGASLGRFPANLIHDGSDEVVGLFPQTGKSTGGQSYSKTSKIYGEYSNDRTVKGCGFGDTGSSARFFYCAKASKRERNIGCEGLEESIVNDGRETDIDNAFQRGITLRKNTHPTVKPIALMEYLVKLVSREGQVILDPFMGSGTTGMACKKLNRDFVGIEMMEDYMEIAKCRIGAVGVEQQFKLEDSN